MAKLINMNVTEAKDVICVWREDTLGEKYGFECGIASESSLGNFMIPRYVLVGVFDDGTTKAAGLHSLNQLNQSGDSPPRPSSGDWCQAEIIGMSLRPRRGCSQSSCAPESRCRGRPLSI